MFSLDCRSKCVILVDFRSVRGKRVGGVKKREACREYRIHWQTLAKILQHAEPPGYRQTKARPSKLHTFLPVIHEILIGDRQVHRKPRHTLKRICKRLSVEHGYDSGWILVKDAV